MPSCLSAARNASSVSSLLSLRICETTWLNCSSESLYPSSSLPRCRRISSSTASTISCGVISATAFFSSSDFGSASILRARSASTWRCSNSVLVMMSPFTLTMICSMISARGAAAAAVTSAIARAAAHNLFFMPILRFAGYPALSCYRSSSPSRPATLVKTPSSARGSSACGRRISALENPGTTSPAVARAVHHEPGPAAGRCVPFCAASTSADVG